MEEIEDQSQSPEYICYKCYYESRLTRIVLAEDFLQLGKPPALGIFKNVVNVNTGSLTSHNGTTSVYITCQKCRQELGERVVFDPVYTKEEAQEGRYKLYPQELLYFEKGGAERIRKWPTTSSKNASTSRSDDAAPPVATGSDNASASSSNKAATEPIEIPD